MVSYFEAYIILYEFVSTQERILLTYILLFEFNLILVQQKYKQTYKIDYMYLANILLKVFLTKLLK